ncbi:hypothetical protein H2509_20420 [Stappia sp. F7233]|uniref:DUF6950 domain-containing protein n=1 Tax=Stappia albiluteola TaxID=2758565 RepID=A0A839AKV6_9HYPH|nr:hypothetical protein [Stappia albiluteola]MBA5779502.1 hypothetical protein [Stappia albiluteola]
MRREDWQERLIEAVQQHAERPFSWGGTDGGTDCFMLAMDAAKAVTGTDPYADERGRYKTRIGALRRFRKRGFGWLEDAFAAVFEPVPVPLAQRGDIGLVEADGQDCAVVVIGAEAVGKSERGTIRVPVKTLRKAFKVGR